MLSVPAIPFPGNLVLIPQSFECGQSSIWSQLGQLVEGKIQPGKVGHPHREFVLLHALQDLAQAREGDYGAVGQPDVHSIASIVAEIQENL